MEIRMSRRRRQQNLQEDEGELSVLGAAQEGHQRCWWNAFWGSSDGSRTAYAASAAEKPEVRGRKRLPKEPFRTMCRIRPPISGKGDYRDWLTCLAIKISSWFFVVQYHCRLYSLFYLFWLCWLILVIYSLFRHCYFSWNLSLGLVHWLDYTKALAIYSD